MTTAALLDRMPTIDLDGIGQAAAWQTRVDRKYLLPAADADRLLAELSGSAQVLQIDGLRVTRYASIYFDTPGLDAYRATAHRRRHRFKVRTRSYLDTAGCFLEVKTRNGRGVTVKQRTEHPLGEVDALAGPARRYVASALAAAGLDPSAIGELDPVLRTDYRRVTLYLPQDGARLTVDSGLTWRRTGRMITIDDLVVLESKSATGRGPVDRRLWSAGHRPTPLSKYATGLALLRPDLPANRWHRVLRQQLRPAGTPIRSRYDATDHGGPS